MVITPIEKDKVIGIEVTKYGIMVGEDFLYLDIKLGKSSLDSGKPVIVYSLVKECTPFGIWLHTDKFSVERVMKSPSLPEQSSVDWPTYDKGHTRERPWVLKQVLVSNKVV